MRFVLALIDEASVFGFGSRTMRTVLRVLVSEIGEGCDAEGISRIEVVLIPLTG